MNNEVNNKHICKYCGKVCKSGISLGGHIVSCKLNPNSRYNTDDFKNKITELAEKKNPKNEYDLICEYCGKHYTLYIKQSDYIRGAYKKTCSITCAHKLGGENCDKEERNKKISNTLKGNPKCATLKGLKRVCNRWINNPNWSPIKYCPTCGKELSYKYPRMYCSKECMIIGRHKKLSDSAKNCNFGGYVPNSIKKHHHGNYMGIHCDSSWELAFLVYNIEHNIPIKRCNVQRTYINHDGKIRKYFPDFIINENIIIEIKGYENEDAKLKSQQNSDIIVLHKNEMIKYLEYVKNKYGNLFWEVLYDK